MSEETKKPTVSILSNKRLNAIRTTLLEFMTEDDVTKAIEKICDIMKFNPDYAKSMYNPKKYESIQLWRNKKAQELGVSVSMIANGKYKKVLAAKTT